MLMAEKSEPSFSGLLKRNDSLDYYEVLGCDELNSKEQINMEFKKKALKYHPDKNTEDDDQMFERLQKARGVLCDDSKRRSYDNWRNSGLKDYISFNVWTRTNAQAHLHWAQLPKKKMLTAESNSCLSKKSTDGYTTTLYRTAHRTDWGSKCGLKRKFQNYEI